MEGPDSHHVAAQWCTLCVRFIEKTDRQNWTKSQNRHHHSHHHHSGTQSIMALLYTVSTPQLLIAFWIAITNPFAAGALTTTTSSALRSKANVLWLVLVLQVRLKVKAKLRINWMMNGGAKWDVKWHPGVAFATVSPGATHSRAHSGCACWDSLPALWRKWRHNKWHHCHHYHQKNSIHLVPQKKGRRKTTAAAANRPIDKSCRIFDALSRWEWL